MIETCAVQSSVDGWQVDCLLPSKATLQLDVLRGTYPCSVAVVREKGAGSDSVLLSQRRFGEDVIFLSSGAEV